MRRLLFAVVLLAATPALASRKPVTADDRERIEQKQAEQAAKTTREGKDIVETAEAAGDFKTLLTLVGEAGIIDTFTGPGPITVFAPSDAAFRKVPKKQLDALRKDKEKLKSVLLGHVVVGKLMAADLEKLDAKLRTASTEEVAVSAKGRKLKFDKANVVKTDVVANNGVIHVIDAVVLPAPAPVALKKGKK
jgi:uncharacterized surface protein with fasciclin (FAS1) repeats